jgi:DNA segregation ATPase FtsK/SpoIIIE-like protein
MITYLLFGMFWVAMAIAIIYIGKAKKDYRDLAFKVDNFEDNIRDAHEKLANSISYQYFDLISKVDDLADRLVEEDVLYKRSAYVNMSDVDLANKVKIYLAFHERRASNMIVQKRFGIPYQRAIAILDLLEKNGVVGPEMIYIRRLKNWLSGLKKPLRHFFRGEWVSAMPEPQNYSIYWSRTV